MRLRLRTILLIAFSLVSALGCVLFSSQIYRIEKQAFMHGLDDQLLAAAAAIPHLLPADYHDRAVTPAAIQADEYQQVRERLGLFAEQALVYYLFTYIRTPDGHWFETTTNERPDTLAAQYNHYFTPYDENNDVLDHVLDSGQAAHFDITDGYGEFRSYYLPMTSPNGQRYIAGADINIDFIDEHLHESLLQAIGIGCLVFAFSVLISLWLSHRLARDLRLISDETHAIGRFELDSESAPSKRSRNQEVHQLFQAVINMKTNLRSFRKFVPADLVRELVNSGQEASLGADKKTVTVFFADIANFTNIAERMPPEALVEHLGDYLHTMSQTISAYDGTVDKFIGDAVMAFWGAPNPLPQHPLSACCAALACQAMLKEQHAQWQSQQRPILHNRIGIHTGELLVGNIGSEQRLNYTVIGDTVNLAARLENLNKYYGTGILISAATHQHVQTQLLTRIIDRVKVKGKTQGTLIYEVITLQDQATAEQQQLVAAYEHAMQKYWQRQWPAAEQAFTQLLSNFPNDGPSTVMQNRCQTYQEHSPAEDWQGVHVMQHK